MYPINNYYTIFFIVILLCNCEADLSRKPRQWSKAYGVTNFQVIESVRRLEKVIRSLDNKLTRHEFREAQVADFSTKTLNALNSDHSVQQKNMKAVARQLAAFEEKILALDSLVKTVDKRQRNLLNNLSDGLNRLLMMRPDLQSPLELHPMINADGDNKKEIKKILTKVTSMNNALNRNIRGVNNEVKIVGESLSQHMDKLSARHDRLLNDWTTCQKDQIKSLAEATSSLSETGSLFVDQIAEAKNFMSSDNSSQICKEFSGKIDEKLNSLVKAYKDQEKSIGDLNQESHKSFEAQKEDLKTLIQTTELQKTVLNASIGSVLKNLSNLQSHSERHLNRLEATIKNVSESNSRKLSKEINSIASVLKTNSETIINSLDDSASMSENLQNSLTENFEDLTRDIKSLKKIEQVMLSTADAVLDTKRSIEFGIQQVILDLGEIVRTSGKTINSTLTDKINDISYAIIRNQTLALTNMTSKMENEISQVWRQIGIMYQQVAQSVSILDELQSTTAQQMNASLDKVDKVDGTVGNINSKVADVEDNLNYLLGRLSLVTSEFSQMKHGIGSELDKLREMVKEFTSPHILEYQANRKRSVYQQVHSSQALA